MTVCSAGATALGYARDLIVGGHADLMIAGGVEPIKYHLRRFQRPQVR